MAFDGWYPGAVRLPISTQEFWQRNDVVKAIVEHVTAGNDSRDYLQNANNSSSTHFLIRYENGKGVVYQFISINLAAWGNGITAVSQYTPQWLKDYIAAGKNPNMCTISVEHERVWPYSTPWPQPQIDASIALNKWIVANVPTIKADRDHIIGHYQIDTVNRPFCPGGPGGKLFPFDEIVAAVQGAPPAPSPAPQPNQTAIEAYASAHPYVGLSVEPNERSMVLEDGNTYQVRFYERALLHWAPGKDVGEARVGAMLLDELVKHGEI